MRATGPRIILLVAVAAIVAGGVGVGFWLPAGGSAPAAPAHYTRASTAYCVEDAASAHYMHPERGPGEIQPGPCPPSLRITP